MLGTMEQRTKGLKKQAQELIEQAYQRGFNAGYEEGKGQAWSDEIKKYEIEPGKAREYIEQGRNDAWEAADKLIRMHMGDIMEVFADDPLRETIDRKSLFRCCTPELAIKKIHEYEEKKQEEEQEILVGDEVYTEDKKIKFVVTGIGEESAHLVDCNGNFSWTKTYCLNKTGRHFHEIENVLEKLQEGNNG